MELPPGFRFHPTDEELITHYLCKKVLDRGFSSIAIEEVDLNKCEPWDLPFRARIGEREWYFFCVRDRKYPTGLRTNRATESGYWKATGKDKDIFKGKALVGMKKTLVFYKGRAPKGVKSNWVMHEYRLDGKFSLYKLSGVLQVDWVICRVFHKSAGGKKVPLSGLVKSGALPLLLVSPSKGKERETETRSLHGPCFSNPFEIQPAMQPFAASLPPLPSGSHHHPHDTLWQSTSSISPQNGEYMNALLESHGSHPTGSVLEDQVAPSLRSSLTALAELDPLWNY